ncbi:hypothetical protein EDB96_3051 [Flavobacterium sp. S87F.05.LMB.W.Kidney.N]|nr:hypothetical protein EDB96_3051 [Flavobacterium sp. S87F.05.LMB.W.Kidney.N]
MFFCFLVFSLGFQSQFSVSVFSLSFQSRFSVSVFSLGFQSRFSVSVFSLGFQSQFSVSVFSLGCSYNFTIHNSQLTIYNSQFTIIYSFSQPVQPIQIPKVLCVTQALDYFLSIPKPKRNRNLHHCEQLRHLEFGILP